MISRKIIFILIPFLFWGKSMNAQSPQVQGLYVNFIYSWLGDQIQENEILNYCAANNFNYITLYDLNRLNWTQTDINNLAAFISKAKNVYRISKVGAAGETYNFFRNVIAPYNAGRAVPDEKIDVFNFEFEFWILSNIQSYYGPNYLIPNGLTADTAGAFTFAMQQFTLIDSLADTTGVMSEIYLGWPNRGQMQAIAQKADRILLHAYRPDDSDVYQYTQSRVRDIASAHVPIEVMPIFSSESIYMGTWLMTHPLTQPYQTYYYHKLADTPEVQEYVTLTGFQWFLYSLMPKASFANAAISWNGPLSFCSGGNVTLTGSTGASYLWSPGGQTTSSIVVDTSGTFTVTITDGLGNVTTSLPVTVTVTNGGPAPVISASGPTIFCSGNQVTLSVTAANSYLWSNGQTTQSITVDKSGTFSVTTETNVCMQN
ncbi:MAG: hypothetical protein IT242_09535, partial [Bacteroidia bacterium]|nr:hypothetical protein [Bacteroidia bacterium]